ncbi:MAG TPA: ribonuclease H-like domain-containing protein [Anaerolineaceae bacterium]
MDTSENLYEKLKSLGVKLGTSPANISLQPQLVDEVFPPSHQDIDSVVNGRNYETHFGSTFLIEKSFPLDYSHGIIHICEYPKYRIISEWSRCLELNTAEPHQIVFLDTETTGLAGGTGTLVFLVGLGFLSSTGFRLYQIFLRDPSEEPAFLTSLVDLLANHTILVTYNGKTFDIPLLNTRFRLNQFASPVQSLGHIDLLPLARRLWRNRLPSRTLGYLEEELLDVHRTQQDVPGWLIPDLYFDYLRTRDARPMAGIIYHNEIDILSLAGLFVMVSNLLNHPIELHRHGLDLAAIARLYAELGYEDEAETIYEHSFKGSIPTEHVIQVLLNYAKVCRDTNKSEKCLHAWQKAASLGSIEAHLKLAKYYEHHTREYLTALYWTTNALDLVKTIPYNQQVVAELTHRKKRLELKQSKAEEK